MSVTLTSVDPDLDRDDVLVLLDLSARIVRGAPADWRTLAEAFRPGASCDQRVAALLLLAGPLTDLVTATDEEVLLRAFLPRLSIVERAFTLRDIREELAGGDRWADVASGAADQPDDDIADPDERAMAFRSSARHIAETAVQK